MKINRLETHDRLLHFKKDQSDTIAQGIEECLKKNPLSLSYQQRSPYVYIFAHPRLSDDGLKTRMLWQPRLGRPKAQTNSYLFRAISNTDNMEVCWMIPPREMWNQYTKGKVTENEYVIWSIHQFQNNRAELEKPFPDDLSDERCKFIILEIAREMEENRRMTKLYTKPESSEASPSS
jgi:hypothetical protein